MPLREAEAADLHHHVRKNSNTACGSKDKVGIEKLSCCGAIDHPMIPKQADGMYCELLSSGDDSVLLNRLVTRIRVDL